MRHESACVNPISWQPVRVCHCLSSVRVWRCWVTALHSGVTLLHFAGCFFLAAIRDVVPVVQILLQQDVLQCNALTVMDQPGACCVAAPRCPAPVACKLQPDSRCSSLCQHCNPSILLQMPAACCLPAKALWWQT